jgi:uncharacterized membrane protein YozB (DUF420 family)
MEGAMNGPGFLGTHADLFTDIALIVGLLLAASFTRGFMLARKGEYGSHHMLQIANVVGVILFVSIVMLLPFRDFILRDQGGPRPTYFYVLTIIHALVGLIALPLGIFVILKVFGIIPPRLPMEKYKTLMRTSYVFFMLATLTGIIIYITWFVFTPIPPKY